MNIRRKASSGTELEFCEGDLRGGDGCLEPTPQKKLILNLPDTVEMATPNIYADQIEWFCAQRENRDCDRRFACTRIMTAVPRSPPPNSG